MDDLASSYRWFAEHNAGEYAPLYREVTRSIADDPDLLDLVTRSPADAHHPGVLLAAVRYLLVDASNDPLAHCYRRRSINGVGEAFRSFALAHADELLLITRIRRVQTNEIARSAILAPVLRRVQAERGKPIALIDVGASAGLNLLLDMVHVDYGHTALGPADSTIQLHASGPTIPSDRSDSRPRSNYTNAILYAS